MKKQRNFMRFTDRTTKEDVVINLNQVSMVDVEQGRLYLHDNRWYVTFKSKDILPNIAEALRDGI